MPSPASFSIGTSFAPSPTGRVSAGGGPPSAGEGLGGAEASLGGRVDQRQALAFGAEDRELDRTGELARRHAQPIGDDPVEADLRPDRLGEAGGAPGGGGG